jgi:hypothetical protein
MYSTYVEELEVEGEDLWFVFGKIYLTLIRFLPRPVHSLLEEVTTRADEVLVNGELLDAWVGAHKDLDGERSNVARSSVEGSKWLLGVAYAEASVSAIRTSFLVGIMVRDLRKFEC